MNPIDSSTRVERVLAYHELSKHRPDGYAPGPGRLDWSNQPDPFRRFDGCPRVQLPLGADALQTAYCDLFSPGTIPPAALGLDSLGTLLQLALGLSAWKRFGDNRWALRCNPSSGNLHPTEAYLIAPDDVGLPGGVHHYLSLEHSLEQRAPIDDDRWQAGFGGNLLVGLTSIHWREAWKYGVRAYRYCQLDAGHALAAIRYAASALGWRAQLLTAPGDQDIAHLLGLDRATDFEELEREDPELLIAVGPQPEALDVTALLELPAGINWQGRAKRLSAGHRAWPAIAEVATACRKPPGPPLRYRTDSKLPPYVPGNTGARAGNLFLGRRSAVAFDGHTGLGREDFFGMLDALLPRPGVPPWDSLPWQPSVHPLLFVHRVNGLPPGLYALPRTPDARRRLQSRLLRDPEWAWEPIPGSRPQLPLYRLTAGDVRELARQIGCHQEIAADSAFSLGMLADFDGISKQAHPWWYRNLFWEAGMLGQTLYLEAEAAGLRGTGIGCFFDDVMHRLLGLKAADWQDIYHFTAGTPVADRRLQTEPPYAHLKKS